MATPTVTYAAAPVVSAYQPYITTPPVIAAPTDPVPALIAPAARSLQTAGLYTPSPMIYSAAPTGTAPAPIASARVPMTLAQFQAAYGTKNPAVNATSIPAALPMISNVARQNAIASPAVESILPTGSYMMSQALPTMPMMSQALPTSDPSTSAIQTSSGVVATAAAAADTAPAVAAAAPAPRIAKDKTNKKDTTGKKSKKTKKSACC